jgi:hypothetical protein
MSSTKLETFLTPGSYLPGCPQLFRRSSASLSTFFWPLSNRSKILSYLKLLSFFTVGEVVNCLNVPGPRVVDLQSSRYGEPSHHIRPSTDAEGVEEK